MEVERKKAWQELIKKNMEQAKQYEPERLRKVEQIKKDRQRSNYRNKTYRDRSNFIQNIIIVIIFISIPIIWSIIDHRAIPVVCIALLPPLAIWVLSCFEFRKKDDEGWGGVGIAALIGWLSISWVPLVLFIGALWLYF